MNSTSIFEHLMNKPSLLQNNLSKKFVLGTTQLGLKDYEGAVFDNNKSLEIFEKEKVQLSIEKPIKSHSVNVSGTPVSYTHLTLPTSYLV